MGLMQGPRRGVVLGGIGALALAGAGAAYLIGKRQAVPPPVSQTQRTGSTNSLPGGTAESEEMARLRQERDRLLAQAALSSGTSHSSQMAGRQVESEQPSTPRRTAQVNAEEERRRREREEKDRKLDKDLAKDQAKVIAGYIAGWDGGRPDLQVVIKPEDVPKMLASADTGRRERETGNGTRAQQEKPKEVLMPGLTGAYGTVVIGSSSDQPGAPIVVELRGGPLNGLRVLGSYDQMQHQNGGFVSGGMVKVTSLTLATGRSVPVEGVLVGPEDMSTLVASRINDHIPERILAPALARGAQIAGQALLYSGSVTGVGALGGFQRLQRFSPERIGGAMAAGAGQGLAQALRESAPNGPTYHLDAKGQVGVFFLKSVEVEQGTGAAPAR